MTPGNVVLLDRDGARIAAAVTPASDGRTIHVTSAGLVEGAALRLGLLSALTDRWGGSNGIDSTTAFTYQTSSTLFERDDFPLDRTSRIGLSRLWQGLEYDGALGLYYVRNRWYDPATGSFLSPDPLGFPDGLNQFTWPYANPWRQDPWGLAGEADIREWIWGMGRLENLDIKGLLSFGRARRPGGECSGEHFSG